MLRALLAEDDPVTALFLREALAALGWRVHAFDTVAAAARSGIEERFDALLLDLNLPDGTGIELLRKIRNRDEHASVDAPALALTADHDPATRQRLLDHGFDVVARKPIGIDELASALASLRAGVPGPDPEPSPGVADVDELPIWDDAAALAGIAHGNPGVLAGLRSLLLQDLPGQRARILAAPDSQAAQDELHKLLAACGFCGAPRLAKAVRALQASAPLGPGRESLQAFARAADELLDQPPPAARTPPGT